MADENEDFGIEPRNTHNVNLMHELLSNPERRNSMHLIKNRGSIELDDLAATLYRALDEEYGLDDDIPEDEIERFEASLHHTHIPKLAETGLVEYDDENNVVHHREPETSLGHIVDSQLGTDLDYEMTGDVTAYNRERIAGDDDFQRLVDNYQASKGIR